MMKCGIGMSPSARPLAAVLALILHASAAIMNQYRFAITSALLATGLTMLGCSHARIPLPSLASVPGDTPVSAARGEYIVRTVAVCGGCHGADEKNPDGPLSGGHEFRDWRIGIARGSNLTPDPETGLGNWSEAEIVRALRNGERKDGRLLAPVMPYEWLHDMSDADAFSVARYLKSIPPVRNAVKQDPNFVFKLGKILFLHPKPGVSVTAPPTGPTAPYGGYLAQHVGMCGECHTPRTAVLAEPKRNRLFAGQMNPPKDFPAKPSNLTPESPTGIGSWSEEDFLKTIHTGTTPDGDEMHPFMPWHQLRRMSDDDLRAIYRYLRTLPPIHNEVMTEPKAPEAGAPRKGER
jgi:cytochrome c553